MPTSVLLAVLAAAGLLALAPALTRRYDAPQRLIEERVTSTARVLSRRRRRRTVPGAVPVNPPRRPPAPSVTAAAAGLSASPAGVPSRRSSSASRSSPSRSAGSRSRSSASRRSRARPRRRRPVPTALHRRRRVLVALVLLNLVELAGVVLVGPGFWIGFSVSFVVLLADLVYLRRRAVATARRQRQVRRRAAWVAAQQAAIRREHERRAAQREAATRRVAASRLDARRLAVPRTERYPRRVVGS